MSTETPEDRKILGNEIFERIREIGRQQFESALSTVRKLAREEEVSDGELLDAFNEIMMHLDILNPLLPLCSEMFKRFMDKIGMAETPGGIKREWCDPDNDE